MRRLQSGLAALVFGFATSALALDKVPYEPTNESIAIPGAGPRQPFVPPGVDYPAIVDRGPELSLYVDHTYESTRDLSTFWWVRGRGSNYRLTFGGVYRSGGFQAQAEIPVQYTLLTIDTLMQQAPNDADRTKAELSLADVIGQGAYFWELPTQDAPTYVGLNLRVRFPTHTTKFKFGLIDGSTMEFGFPYYLHLAPSMLLSTSYGPLFLVANQGLLAMLAKDIDLGGVLQKIPNLYFWESHVAAGVAATDWLSFTLELLSFAQLNRASINDPTSGQQANIDDVKAVFLNPGLTIDLGDFRLAMAGRLDLSGRSSRDFGTLTFSGSRAFLTRLSYLF